MDHILGSIITLLVSAIVIEEIALILILLLELK